MRDYDYHAMLANEGYEARKSGKSLTDNPYKKNTEDHEYWIVGWFQRDNYERNPW